MGIFLYHIVVCGIGMRHKIAGVFRVVFADKQPAEVDVRILVLYVRGIESVVDSYLRRVNDCRLRLPCNCWWHIALLPLRTRPTANGGKGENDGEDASVHIEFPLSIGQGEH